MAETYDMLRSYTPQEINQLQQILSQRYQEGALQNQNMNTVANMTKNLSPAANLGIALGTLGGNWLADRYNNLQRIQAEKDNRYSNFLSEGITALPEILPNYSFYPHTMSAENINDTTL